MECLNSYSFGDAVLFLAKETNQFSILLIIPAVIFALGLINLTIGGNMPRWLYRLMNIIFPLPPKLILWLVFAVCIFILISNVTECIEHGVVVFLIWDIVVLLVIAAWQRWYRFIDRLQGKQVEEVSPSWIVKRFKKVVDNVKKNKTRSIDSESWASRDSLKGTSFDSKRKSDWK